MKDRRREEAVRQGHEQQNVEDEKEANQMDMMRFYVENTPKKRKSIFASVGTPPPSNSPSLQGSDEGLSLYDVEPVLPDHVEEDHQLTWLAFQKGSVPQVFFLGKYNPLQTSWK